MATGPSPQLRALLGPKVDRWLVYTAAGLLVCIGAAQLTSTADDAGEKGLEAVQMRQVARPAPIAPK